MSLPTAPVTEMTCPRCHAPFVARFYGPCPDCRAELIATLRREPEQLERPAYEPKANVVANQVATKD
jgi:hypothetical protein